MATFKATGYDYNPKISAEDNLRQFINEHNNFVNNVTNTINNLDDENLATNLYEQIFGEDE